MGWHCSIALWTGVCLAGLAAVGCRPGSPGAAAPRAISRTRTELRTAVEQRTAKMIKDGLIDEVRVLRGRIEKDWPPLKSVGYREVGTFLDGELREDELLEKICTSTMQLAKRQTTWFKRSNDARWFHPDLDFEQLRSQVCNFLK